MSTLKVGLNLQSSSDRFLFKLGSASLLLGTIFITVLSFVHPHQADPNNNLAVFAEYAADTNWLSTHLGQLFSNFLILIVAAFALYRSLDNEKAANLARVGMITAVLGMAVFTVDQGLDGVALKRAVDVWAAAPEAVKDVYFAAAESIRWLEYGLNGMYNILLGLFTLFFSIAMVVSAVYPKWLGWTGAIAGGIARIIVGTATLSSGFSVFVGVAGMTAFLGGTIWVLAVTVLLWKQSKAQ